MYRQSPRFATGVFLAFYLATDHRQTKLTTETDTKNQQINTTKQLSESSVRAGCEIQY